MLAEFIDSLQRQVGSGVLSIVVLMALAVLVILVMSTILGSLYSWRERSAKRIEDIGSEKSPEKTAETSEETPSGFVADLDDNLKELLPPNEKTDTKLDLAKALVDMGDADIARETLLEIINEGDASQVKAARDLMSKL